MQQSLRLRTSARFFLLLLPRILVGKCTPTRIAGYAIELKESGNPRLAGWCWKQAVNASFRQPDLHHSVIEKCMETGLYEAVVSYARLFYRGSGFEPREAAELLGRFALRDRFEEALQVYELFYKHCSGDILGNTPSPMPNGRVDGERLKALLTELSRSSTDEGARAVVYRDVARLCFSCGAFEICGLLFTKAEGLLLLDNLDRIAFAYAQVRSARAENLKITAGVNESNSFAGTTDGDWQLLLATAYVAAGEFAAASAIVEKFLHSCFSKEPDRDDMIEECRSMLRLICKYEASERLHRVDNRRIEQNRRAKIFVCGSGWSGSGALYDALRDFEGLAHAPNTPLDCYMNVGTDNEMMFVQGPCGLGSLWRAARDRGVLSRLELWDLFRLHVLGGGAIGYSEHKTARVSINLRRSLGRSYVTAFLRLYEDISGPTDSSSTLDIRGILLKTTEALSEAIERAWKKQHHCTTECKAVVFNNAIFATNIDMLEIFSNAKAAVVTRDPLDQFADRRSKDIKHWMMANRFAALYRGSRQAYRQRLSGLPKQAASQVIEVSFERFVTETKYRDSTLDWLLSGRKVTRARRFFEPEQSLKNIGLGAMQLSKSDRRYLVPLRARGRWS